MADVDVNGQTVEGDVIVEPTNGEGTPAVGQVSDQVVDDNTPEPSEPFQLQWGDETFSEEDIKAWRDAHINMSKWRGELAKKGEELNTQAKVLEMLRQQYLQGGTPQVNAPATEPQITGEQLKELFEVDPEKAKSVINSMVQEAVRESTSRMSAEQAFYGHYPDYQQMVQTPEFQQFLQTNPGFSSVNAYFALKNQNLEKQIEEAKKAGFLKGQEVTIKNMRAKGALKVLRPGGGAPAPNPVDIKNMSHAERVNAATQAILAARQEHGG